MPPKIPKAPSPKAAKPAGKASRSPSPKAAKPAGKTSRSPSPKKADKKPGGKKAPSKTLKVQLIGDEWNYDAGIVVEADKTKPLEECLNSIQQALEVPSLEHIKFYKTTGEKDQATKSKIRVALEKTPTELKFGALTSVIIYAKVDYKAQGLVLYLTGKEWPFSEKRCLICPMDVPLKTLVPEICKQLDVGELSLLTAMWGEGTPPEIRPSEHAVPLAKSPAQMGISGEALIWFAMGDEVDSVRTRASKIPLPVPVPALHRAPHPNHATLLYDGHSFDVVSRWRLPPPDPKVVYFNDDDMPVPEPAADLVDKLLARWEEVCPERAVHREEAKRVLARYHDREDALFKDLQTVPHTVFPWGQGHDSKQRSSTLKQVPQMDITKEMKNRLWETRKMQTWDEWKDHVHDVRTEGTVPLSDAVVTAGLCLVSALCSRLWWAPPWRKQVFIKGVETKEAAIGRFHSAVAKRRKILKAVLTSPTASLLDQDIRVLISKMAIPNRDLPVQPIVEEFRELQQVLTMVAHIHTFMAACEVDLRSRIERYASSPLRERATFSPSPRRDALPVDFESPLRTSERASDRNMSQTPRSGSPRPRSPVRWSESPVRLHRSNSDLDLLPKGRKPLKSRSVRKSEPQEAEREVRAPSLPVSAATSEMEAGVRFMLDSFYALHCPSGMYKVEALVVTILNDHSYGTAQSRLAEVVTRMCHKYGQRAGDWIPQRAVPSLALTRHTLESFHTAYDPDNVPKASVIAHEIVTGPSPFATLRQVIKSLCERWAHNGAHPDDWLGPYPPCLQLLHHPL